MARNIRELALLEGANTASAGSAVSVENQKGWTFLVVATGVTTGATVQIQAKVNGEWQAIHEEVVTASGTSDPIRDEHGHYHSLRAEITSYTDGTYDVEAVGTNIQKA